MIGASTPWEVHDLLTTHERLVFPDVEIQLRSVADRVTSDDKKRHSAAGVDAAFDELLAPGAPPVVPSEFEVPLDELHALQDALASGDAAQVEALQASSPRLVAFMNLQESALELTRTRGLEDMRAILERRPELLHPTADKALRSLANAQRDDNAKQMINGVAAIVARSRNVGVARALHEMTRFWEQRSADAGLNPPTM